jgi:hypothetical protein
VPEPCTFPGVSSLLILESTLISYSAGPGPDGGGVFQAARRNPCLIAKTQESFAPPPGQPQIQIHIHSGMALHADTHVHTGHMQAFSDTCVPHMFFHRLPHNHRDPGCSCVPGIHLPGCLLLMECGNIFPLNVAFVVPFSSFPH